jgi:hypothetical protein
MKKAAVKGLDLDLEKMQKTINKNEANIRKVNASV